MPAHIACRPTSFDGHPDEGCFVVCAQHDLRYSFGFAHDVAHAAAVEHNKTSHQDTAAQRPTLLSVVYESSAAFGFDAIDLPSLYASSRVRNRAFGITGMLLAEHGRFLQALEGPALIVEKLVETIKADPRHQHVRILARDSITTRRFPDWAMAEGHIGDLEALPLEQYYEGLLTTRARSAEQRAKLIWVA